MGPILVLYATREGHTHRIAEHVAATLRARGRTAEVLDAAHLPPSFALGSYSAAILAASVHAGEHEREMVEFARRYRAELDGMRTGFLSVSLAEAGAEDPTFTPERRAQAAADVQRMMVHFYDQTGWHPSRAKAVAGALLYTKYNFLVRLLMRHIVGKAGGSTDTSRDHEYTDWQALDRFVDELVE
jgi:menaquinone-dependent protoporphyrinogen oxidase